MKLAGAASLAQLHGGELKRRAVSRFDTPMSPFLCHAGGTGKNRGQQWIGCFRQNPHHFAQRHQIAGLEVPSSGLMPPFCQLNPTPLGHEIRQSLSGIPAKLFVPVTFGIGQKVQHDTLTFIGPRRMPTPRFQEESATDCLLPA